MAAWPAGWLDTEVALLTDGVSCDKSLLGGKPLAADALFGRFLPRLGRLWQRRRPPSILPACSPPLCYLGSRTQNGLPTPGRALQARLTTPPRRDAGRGA